MQQLERVAVYARVSAEPHNSNQAIASQLEALKARVESDGQRLPADQVFIDDGYSGATLVRPALERLRDLAAAGGLDRVYVHSPDRRARRYAYQVLLTDELHRAGVQIASSTVQSGCRPRMTCCCRFRAWWRNTSAPRSRSEVAAASCTPPARDR
jgi:site-specific DNA recombinase